ncbi:type II toxin-antitoxin system RelE family toxin [Spirosoma arcticum]
MESPGSAYAVEYDEAALRDLKKLPKKAQGQIIELADDLAKNPRPEGVESLKQFKGLYRVRVGSYRVVYSIEDGNKVVIIAAIGDRKDIYKLTERRFT